MLTITNLHASVNGKPILNGIDLEIEPGQVHAIMGPNGSGKSTLAHVLSAHPGYKVLGGSVTLDGVSLLELDASERARAGLMLAMQQPVEVPGVRPVDLLVAAGASGDAVETMRAEAERVGLRADLLERFVNVDLSGGEKKRAEMVQLAVLKPKFAILDEIDSGLDVDALHAVGERLSAATKEWNCGLLAITHFRRLLDVVTPNVIHVMSAGVIVASGGAELAETLERDGYEPFKV